MALFSKKIKCVHCGGNYISKKERGKHKYICRNYDKLGKEYCRRIVISEEFLMELLNRRFEADELTVEEMVDEVELIEVDEKLKFTINFNNDEPIIFGDNFIQY